MTAEPSAHEPAPAGRPSLLRHGEGLLRQVLRVLSAPLREALIEFAGLSTSLRVLALLGYLVVALMLFLTLGMELLRAHLPVISYQPPSAQVLFEQIPIPALFVVGLGVVLGGAYVLTGATDARPVVFVPLVVFAFALLCLLTPFDGPLPLLWCGAAPALLAVLIVVHLFKHSKYYWRGFPLVEFAIWCAVLAAYAVGFWFAHPQKEELAATVSGMSNLLLLLTIPLWSLSGLAMVDAAIDVARGVVTTLRRLFAARFVRALAVALVVTRPLMFFALFLVDTYVFPGEQAMTMQQSPLGVALVLDAFLAAPLLLLLAALALFRRWNTRAASVTLAISIASPVFTLGLVMALLNRDISDVMGLAVEGAGFLPSLVVFVAITAHGLLSMGSAFANQEGRAIPRSGRVSLCFGVTLLVISVVVALVSPRDTSGQSGQVLLEAGTNAFFALSVFFFGLPYLLWVIWRRRDRLAGREAELEGVQPVLPGLARALERKWAAVAVAWFLAFLCLACLLGVVIVSFPWGSTGPAGP